MPGDLAHSDGWPDSGVPASGPSVAALRKLGGHGVSTLRPYALSVVHRMSLRRWSSWRSRGAHRSEVIEMHGREELLRFVGTCRQVLLEMEKAVRVGGPWSEEVYRRATLSLADLKLLRQALADAHTARRYCVMGLLRAQQGMLKSAVEDLEKAAALDPDGCWGEKARQRLEELR